MKKDKIRIFILETLLVAILFFALFALNIVSRWVLAIVLGIYAVAATQLYKRRKIVTAEKKYATLLMVIFAIFYIAIFYLLGLYFGFTRAKILLSISTILRIILPLSIIIISSEVLRRVFLSQKLQIKIKSLKLDISPILTFIAMIIIDILVYAEVYNLAKLDDFLTVLGFVFFASLSCNLLYNYITNRHGVKGIIIYRLATVLFVYIIPITPNVYIFFRSFLRMLYPYIIYVIFEKLFRKEKITTAKTEQRREFIGNTVFITLAALLVMLISCQFKYGIIVVGSESMTGSLNKGDAVIFEKYKNQPIENGQVIIFKYNDIQTIHRVVEIQKVNGEIRYYTKGDANARNDNEYRTDKDIYALVNLRVKYIGYPTLWVRELFS
ncbi:MAG: signal peptidase I [Bacilli bacterium]|nr:signal peptidase I [Bacilli bacterium]